MTVPPQAAADDLADAFKAAMRRLAATVTIISTRDGLGRFGMTATAVTSVSATPPSLLVSINRDASIHEPLIKAGGFCVNILDCDHQQHCFDFSGKKEGEARFAEGAWAGDDGLPYLEDAQANLFCEVDATLPYATHTIFIGRVTGVLTRDGGAPLIYLDGGFVPRDAAGGH